MKLDRLEIFYFHSSVNLTLRSDLEQMNQGVFWWAGRKGQSGTSQLYRLTRDYLVKQKGIKNVVWVWNVQDFGSLGSDVYDYHPGSSHYDIASLDIYGAFDQWKYDAMVKISNENGGKPIAIGECAKLPSASQISSQPKWVFFMSWSELTFTDNSVSTLQSIYGRSDVLTLEEMPGWSPGVGPTPPAPAPTSSPPSGNLGDWAVCTSSSQCTNKCCSGKYSGGTLKCTPLGTGFDPNANGCVGGSPAPVPSSPPTSSPPSGNLGDWAVCTSSSQCTNKCCSGKYSGGTLKCTPLGTGFDPNANGCVAGRMLRARNQHYLNITDNAGAIENQKL
jgi:hypothetical protein